MILRATEQAIQALLQIAVDDITNFAGAVPVLLSDEEENKPPMPYIVAQCVEAEEQISPGCGIFKVSGEIRLRSHTKGSSPDERQELLDAINNFAYNSTATKLSALDDFHCYGWQPTTGALTVEPETKSYLYTMKYTAICMARDNT